MDTRATPAAALAFAMLLTLPAAAIADGSPAAGTSAEALRQELAEAIDAMRQYSAAQREQAIDEANEMLADLDAYIGDLEDRIERQWSEMSEAARQQAQDALARLRAQREKLAAALDELQASSGSAWEEVKEGFVESYRALREAFDDAAKELSGD